ncbi:ComEA family DNA-binding protein [Kushneria phosphatilytica]|uniref:ComEA family DNA-binding protein n=1 Tax=Kushneria phosphatilytica TaxID=657387 RepID=A0A1S1NZA1_9GAMM|nr:ComEA family DNA-binding protein [Kushneria phosphatilytica]OHV12203.1 hypothetical protein BH688_06015 [Kushneria phosphatilytica]QEL11395.1 ComEA family DNA-binding protein [Kushneria phosphatilytica]
MRKILAAIMTLVALGLMTPTALADDTSPASRVSVNINTATVEELASLPGIGEKKAADIIEDRKAHGEYDSVDSLTRVKGIGEATVDGLRDRADI